MSEQIKIKSLSPFEIEVLEDIKKGTILNLTDELQKNENTLNKLIEEKYNQYIK